MRGRKPDSAALKLAKGNPARRPVNMFEPAPARLVDDCPEEIVDPVARAEWARGIVPNIETGQLTAADRVLAIAHCQLWATWRKQLATADGSPEVELGPYGRAIENAARNAANKTLALLRNVEAELGFSPTSRPRVKAAPGGKAAASNPLAKWLGKGVGA